MTLHVQVAPGAQVEVWLPTAEIEHPAIRAITNTSEAKYRMLTG
jgi:hypothetical protein